MVAEQNIIGEMLMSPEIISEVSAILEPQMFATALYGKMFFVLVQADRQGIIPDASYLIQKTACDDFPRDVVEWQLGEILKNSPLSIYYKTDCKTIYDEYNARQFDWALSQIKASSVNVYDQIEQLKRRLDSISPAESGAKTVREIADGFKGKYFKKHDRPLMKTGFAFLDDLLGGFEGGDLIVIAARPAVGKSAFGMQMASQIAESGFKVHLFNLEMTEKQIYERLASYEGGISQHRLRTAEGFQNEEERIRFDNANIRLAERSNLFVTTGSKAVSEIRRECKQTKPDLIIVDYLQLLKPDASYRGNRYAEVGAISHAIKALAMEMGIPIVVLSQLNRRSEGTDDKEPSMADIRESGDVEQDAGTIILLWNKDREDRSKKGCKVEKNRNGETGRVDLVFNGSEMRFEDAKNGFVKASEKDLEDMPFAADE